jgi:hypothetical protein
MNTSNQPVVFRIQASNGLCTGSRQNVNLQQEVLSEEAGIENSGSNISAKVIIPAQGKAEFTILLSRPIGTALNTWNCTDVKAIGITGETLSNNLVIESFLPDPKDFR